MKFKLVPLLKLVSSQEVRADPSNQKLWMAFLLRSSGNPRWLGSGLSTVFSFSVALHAEESNNVGSISSRPLRSSECSLLLLPLPTDAFFVRGLFPPSPPTAFKSVSSRFSCAAARFSSSSSFFCGRRLAVRLQCIVMSCS